MGNVLSAIKLNSNMHHDIAASFLEFEGPHITKQYINLLCNVWDIGNPY